MKTFRNALVLGFLSIFVLACDGENEVAMLAEDSCEGFVILTKKNDLVSIGPLKCNGICDDGEKCTVQTNKTKDREWCGCKNQPEPTFCHVVRVKVGENWALSCAGPCPVSTDVCTPSKRKGAKENESVFECKCKFLGDL